MTPEDAREMIRAALLTVAPDAELGEVGPDADLREELDLDSIDFQAYAAELGRRSGLTVTEDDQRRLTTLAAGVTFLTR
ncbi:phosphopantetheine-binding protein [Lentzea sp. NPDC102401]|uniref:phosphopantetheine-binding protein n=1 Tax=Lentzea sp. NPDC102401 TaxID=3364128 RepID=UPI00381FCF1E